ncbi:ANTAR domain-containing protein [Cellulosimicrobium funkei]|uniref:ANTAR domain-containing protein n=1 Tax=Cellulosimicrobium funkei TaxID=264251 RepID=UPI0036F801EC
MGAAPDLLEVLSRALSRVDRSLPLATRLCQASATVLGARSAALTVAPTADDRLTVSTADGLAARIEGLGQVIGEGPVQRALSEDHIVVSGTDDGRHEHDFPVFSHAVEAITGQGAYHAVPMHAGGRVVGVLSLVTSSRTLARGPEDVQLLADAVGLSLLGDLDSLDWAPRAEVHQATGMVTAQLRIPPGDALAVLRAHAFARSTTLDDVAEEVVTRRLSFAYDEEHAVQTLRTDDG